MFFSTFIAPITILGILNTFLFVPVMWTFFKTYSNQSKRRSINRKHRMKPKEFFKLGVSIFGIMCLIGMTWIFGLFTFIRTTDNNNIHASFAIQLLFNIFNSFQGFFLFIFLVLSREDARQAWKKLLFPQRCFKLTCLGSKPQQLTIIETHAMNNYTWGRTTEPGAVELLTIENPLLAENNQSSSLSIDDQQVSD